MKKVHDTKSVMALWADKLQGEARNPSRNVFFYGDTIYSYGTHFPMGRHVETKNGPATLITLATYSKATAKHVSQLRGICGINMVVFHVYDLNANPLQQFLGYAARQGGMLDAWKKARVRKPQIRGEMRALVSEANHFAKAFGLSVRMVLPVELEEADAAEMKTGLDARDALQLPIEIKTTGKQSAETGPAVQEYHYRKYGSAPTFFENAKS
jgi:hypothetical protein